MVRIVEAIFENGSFKPVIPILMPEHRRVLLSFEETPSANVGEPNARGRMIEGFAKMTLETGGTLPARAELHERD